MPTVSLMRAHTHTHMHIYVRSGDFFNPSERNFDKRHTSNNNKISSSLPVVSSARKNKKKEEKNPKVVVRNDVARAEIDIEIGKRMGGKRGQKGA